MYSIQDLETLSGIKAHTIRIWEKRYQLLEPLRSKTNIRAYNDEQLKKLLHVSTLIQHGNKISRIAALNDEEVHTLIEQLSKPENKNTQAELFINQLVAAGMSYDIFFFESAFSSALTRFGIHQCYVSVILPTMVRVGLLWSKNKLIPSQEHFVSNLIRQKLFSAIDGLSIPESGAKKFVLFLPAKEDHEIGLLFAHYLLKQAGHDVVYLGSNVPSSSLRETIKSFQPDAIMFFLVRNWPEKELEIIVKQIEESFKEGQIYLSARASILASITLGENWLTISNIEELQSTI